MVYMIRMRYYTTNERGKSAATLCGGEKELERIEDKSMNERGKAPDTSRILVEWKCIKKGATLR